MKNYFLVVGAFFLLSACVKPADPVIVGQNVPAAKQMVTGAGAVLNGWTCSNTSTREPGQLEAVTATKCAAIGRIELDGPNK